MINNRIFRQTVHLGFIHQQIKDIQSLRLSVPIDVCFSLTQFLELCETRIGSSLKLVNFTE